MMLNIYSIYGINISIPFECPRLQLAPEGTVPDLIIEEGCVPFSLTDPVANINNWQAKPGQFLLRGGRRSGRFLVENGNRIVLQKNPGAESERLFISLSTGVLAALFCQRGQLVLHASVVTTPRGAIAISGESGVGKSTAQATLLTRGCRMLTDDVTVLNTSENGQILALPGISKINLCDDAIIKLGIRIESLQRNPLRIIKAILPVSQDRMIMEPVPLRELYLLRKYSGKWLRISQTVGADKFTLLQECLYGPLFPEEHPGMFSTISALADQIELKILERPMHGCSVEEVAEAIYNG